MHNILITLIIMINMILYKCFSWKGVNEKMTISEDTKLKVSNANRVNPYTDITSYELGIAFPIVSYMGFHPQPSEVLIYAAPACTFKDKEQVVGYTGKSAGVSVRVAKGMSVRTGSSGGRPIRDDVRKFNVGDLLITNQRILFVGKDDTFDFKVEKISTVKLLDRSSFVIQSGKSFKNIGLDPAIIAYAYGLINYVINENSKGTDIYSSVMETQSKLTREQLELCDRVRMESAAVRSVKDKPKKKAKMKIIFIILLLFFVVRMGAALSVSGLSSSSANEVQYTATELVSLNGHPVAFDSFEKAREFYEGNKNVRIYDTMKNGGSYTKSEEYLIYMDNGASHSEFVDEIVLNLNLSEEFKGIALDEVIDIAVDYLPMDILTEYYDIYRVFIHGNDSVKTYHYSWRLNSEGIEYHNNGHPELNRDYGFVIKHDMVSDTYTITINLFADDVNMAGYHDSEWIEKNTDPWNIDLSSYVD